MISERRRQSRGRRERRAGRTDSGVIRGKSRGVWRWVALDNSCASQQAAAWQQPVKAVENVISDHEARLTFSVALGTNDQSCP